MMSMPSVQLKTCEDTEAFGAQLWQCLPEKALVFLHGELGAGKTTLVRGLLRAAGYRGTVKSPTYTLVEEYVLGGRLIFHFDLYRLKSAEELEWIGIDDYLQQSAICLIEWAEMGQALLPKPDLELHLSYHPLARIVKVNCANSLIALKLKVK